MIQSRNEQRHRPRPAHVAQVRAAERERVQHGSGDPHDGAGTGVQLKDAHREREDAPVHQRRLAWLTRLSQDLSDRQSCSCDARVASEPPQADSQRGHQTEAHGGILCFWRRHDAL